MGFNEFEGSASTPPPFEPRAHECAYLADEPLHDGRVIVYMTATTLGALYDAMSYYLNREADPFYDLTREQAAIYLGLLELGSA